MIIIKQKQQRNNISYKCTCFIDASLQACVLETFHLINKPAETCRHLSVNYGTPKFQRFHQWHTVHKNSNLKFYLKFTPCMSWKSNPQFLNYLDETRFHCTFVIRPVTSFIQISLHEYWTFCSWQVVSTDLTKSKIRLVTFL